MCIHLPAPADAKSISFRMVRWPDASFCCAFAFSAASRRFASRDALTYHTMVVPICELAAGGWRFLLRFQAFRIVESAFCGLQRPDLAPAFVRYANSLDVDPDINDLPARHALVDARALERLQAILRFRRW